MDDRFERAKQDSKIIKDATFENFGQRLSNAQT